jgi:hypothetical protein
MDAWPAAGCREEDPMTIYATADLAALGYRWLTVPEIAATLRVPVADAAQAVAQAVAERRMVAADWQPGPGFHVPVFARYCPSPPRSEP